MDVVEITPLSDYDPAKARLQASLRWLISKASDGDREALYRQPFHLNQQNEVLLESALTEGLTSADLYCKACANIFRDSTSSQWQGHWNVIQTLSRKGIYVVEESESAVTDTMLTQKQPFKLNAHLAMIEAMMTAYAGGVVSVERVVQAVRRFASFNASSELPYDVEDALLFWINKVCSAVRKDLESPRSSREGQADCIVVQKGQMLEREPPHIPVMEDLLKDLSDGCCLATVVSFYCPGALKLEEISLKENVGIADSLHNLQLLKAFCERHLPGRTFHLTLDDMLYTNEKIKHNILAFVAELFYWFEVQKAECVRMVTQDQKLLSQAPEAVRTDADKPPKSAVVTSVPISNVTKRSFQQNDGRAGSNPDLRQVPSSPTLPHRQPLLPKRLQQTQQDDAAAPSPVAADLPTVPLHSESAGGNIVLPFGNTYRTFRRSNSLTSAEDRDIIKQSVAAWEESGEAGQGDGQVKARVVNSQPAYSAHMKAEMTSRSPVSQHSLTRSPQPSASVPSQSADSHRTSATMLGNVSIDSALSDSTMDDLGSSISLDLSEFEDTPRSGIRPVGPLVNPQKMPVGPVAAHSRQGNPYHVEDMKLESVSSRTTSRGSDRSAVRGSDSGAASNRSPFQKQGQGQSASFHPGAMEPLMPAMIRPAKEKLSNHTKQVESGEMHQKRSPSTPTKPNSLSFKPREYKAGSDTGSSSSDEDYQTPSLEVNPSFPPSAPVTLIDSTTRSAQSPVRHSDQLANHSQPRKYEAFYVDTIHGPIVGPPLPERHNGPVNSARVKPTESFTLHDHVHTPESARAAGIPVVDSADGGDHVVHYAELNTHHDDSRSSGRSSSEFSDQELRKIHYDHKHKENRPDSHEHHDMHRPDSLVVPKPVNMDRSESPSYASRGAPENPASSPKTSFAQIRKMRENGESKDESLDFYAPNQNEGHQEIASIMKSDNTQRVNTARQSKKTTFAALPNQTTWQESAQRREHKYSSDKENLGSDTLQPLATELVSMKLRLEEKRREIEMKKKKIESQMSKQRQRVGKEAFLSIVTKSKSTEELSREPDSSASRTAKIIANSMTQEDISKPRVSFREPQSSVSSRHILEEKPGVVYRDSNRSTPPPGPQPRGSPRSQSPRIGSDSEKSPRGKFTREEILETIDTVKQKYLKDADSPAVSRRSARPKSFHEDQISSAVSPPPVETAQVVHRSNSGRVQGQRPKSFHAGAQVLPSDRDSPLSHESSEDYSNSLDKLNKSLSELQGEIMKLSIQQEQIKTLSDSSPRTRTPTPPRGASEQREKLHSQSPPVASLDNRQEHFYMNTQSSRSQPDLTSQNRLGQTSNLSQSHGSLPMPGSHHDSLTMPDRQQQQQPQPNFLNSSQGHYPILGQNYPQMQQQQPYMMPPGQYHTPPQQYMQPGYGQYPPGMPPPMQPGYGQTAAMYQQPPQQQMYPIPPHHHYPQNQYVLPGQQPPYPTSSVSGLYPSTSSFTPQGHPASTYTVSTQQTRLSSPGDTIPTPGTDYPFPSTTGPYDLSPSMMSSPSDSIRSFPVPDKTDMPTPSTPKNPSPTLSLPSAASPIGMSPVDDGQKTPVIANGGQSESLPSNKGFFISFGEDAAPPKRQKPKLRNKEKKDAKDRSNGKLEKSGKEGIASKDDTPSAVSTTPPKPKPELIVAPPMPVSPAVGFSIGEESDKKNELAVTLFGHVSKVDEDEIQKKKEKILQMQLKRKEEQEKKRLEREQKMSKKMEEQRLKEEKAEQKKADEKARREAIYQQYLQRKAAEQEEEDGDSGRTPPKKPTPKAKSKPKPKHTSHSAAARSAGGGGAGNGQEDRHSVSSHSHSSQEDVSLSKPTGNSRGGSMGNIATVSADSNGGYSLAYGGLTHRRPPTPPHGRGNQGDSDSGSNMSAEYAGPKLFVKPSSKSNRHIISNAISHCCLAGVVNKPLKDSALEVIEQSEAKHFVILFRDGSMSFRALYTYDPDTEEVVKIHGTGPKVLTIKMYEKFYKYNSGLKSFTEVKSTKHLSVAIDAVVILNSFWQKKAPPSGGAYRRPGMR